MSEEYEESKEKRSLKWNFHYWYHYLNSIKLSTGLGFFHVNLPFVGLTLVPWGQASENDLGWSMGIPECHKCRNCYCCVTFVSCEQWLQVMIALCICVVQSFVQFLVFSPLCFIFLVWVVGLVS